MKLNRERFIKQSSKKIESRAGAEKKRFLRYLSVPDVKLIVLLDFQNWTLIQTDLGWQGFNRDHFVIFGLTFSWSAGVVGGKHAQKCLSSSQIDE